MLPATLEPVVKSEIFIQILPELAMTAWYKITSIADVMWSHADVV